MSINIFSLITDRLIEELKNGVIPWHKPWFGTWNGAYSRAMGRPYSLANQLLLAEPGEYLTFNQINALGGRVKAGSRAKPVFFYKICTKRSENDDEEDKTFPIFHTYYVFHINQTEGIKPLSLEEQLEFLAPCEDAEKVIDDYISASGVGFNVILSDRAFYNHREDSITIPAIEQYTNVADYYSTAFHEIIHSTGHQDRLNRLVRGTLQNDRERYAKEELIAEIGAAALCHHCNVETPDAFQNSAAYIQGWLEALENDERLILSASNKAQKAVDFILNINKNNEIIGGSTNA